MEYERKVNDNFHLRAFICSFKELQFHTPYTGLRGLSPRANYTERETDACRQS
jgi:hypothetical protein